MYTVYINNAYQLLYINEIYTKKWNKTSRYVQKKKMYSSADLSKKIII